MYEKPTITQINPKWAAYLLYDDQPPPIRRSKSEPVKMPIHNRGAKTINTGIKWVRT